MAIATGQITIIDYNDALTLTGYVSSNLAKTQAYNPDNGTYLPNWVSTNLVLTASLFKMGGSSNIIGSAEVQTVEWYDVTSGTESKITANTTHVISGTKGQILTIKANTMAGVPGKDYMVKVLYKDPSTGMTLTHKFDISFSRVVNGSGITDAVVTAIDGIVFKNDTVASLRAKAELWRGSVVDTTSVAYTWYQMDSSSPDQGAGAGWRKVISTTSGITGYNTNTLTVTPAAVTNIGVFMVHIKDTDSASTTYNTTFIDTITFADQSDPIQVSVKSSGGDVFKNGAGTSTLTAQLFRAGAEIDSGGTGYTYKWFKYDQNSNLISNFGGTGVNFKTGKSITVGDADVDVKATFLVEVS